MRTSITSKHKVGLFDSLLLLRFFLVFFFVSSFLSNTPFSPSFASFVSSCLLRSTVHRRHSCDLLNIVSKLENLSF